MKKSLFINLSLVLLLPLFASCGNDNNSVSNNGSSNGTSNESSISSNSPSTPDHYITKNEYILEDGEMPAEFNVKNDKLIKLPNSKISINGLQSLITNPFESSILMGSVVNRYPTAELLEGQNILYTSAWYNQKTFKRSDDCLEYVLLNEEGYWYVEDISTTAETFIPFNGAVLSVPKNSTYKLDVGSEIEFSKGSIPVYDIGFYNQNGNRVAVEAANKLTWNENSINLYDQNYISKVTPSAWHKHISLNCYYDGEKNAYIVDKFRSLEKQTKIYTNVHNGFMLAATAKSGIDQSALIEGVRFNLGDTLYAEENGDIENKSFDFSLNSENKVILENGKTISFTIKKVDTFQVGNKWLFEVGVNKDNIIVSSGSNVEIPENGYKLSLKNETNTQGEQINQLLENVFIRASRVMINGNNISIINSTNQRLNNLHKIVSQDVEDTIESIKKYNYSYDVDTIFDIQKQLISINDEIKKLKSASYDATNQYRIYALLGQINQQYFRLISATNRNEPVQVKTTWYIHDFAGNDSTLEKMTKQLDTIAESGTNEIIVSVMSNGYVHYANSKLYTQFNKVVNKDYGEYGNDFIKAIISEGHKRNLKVIAGFNPFTEGMENNFKELKDAYALSINGATSVVTGQGTVKMLDPANPIVQQRIKDTINDFLTANPNFDGVHLDYIRYGADNNYINTVMGVTESALTLFKEYCNTSNYEYTFNTLDELRNLLKTNNTAFTRFNTFQAGLITNTVKNVKEVCKEYDLHLSCAVADDSSYVKTWKCQDWGTWAKLGYVDALYLMDYYFDEYFINYYFEDMVKATGNNSILVCGIDPSYANLISEYYPKTIKGALQNSNSFGYGIFGTHTQAAKKDGWDLIKDSNWIKSISPFEQLKTTMKVSSDVLLNRCDNIYIEYGNQTASQKDLLKQDLDTLCSLAIDDTASTCNSLLLHIESMLSKTYANNEAQKRIEEQLLYMYKIAKAKLNVVE